MLYGTLMTTSTMAALVQAEPGGFAFGDFWSLTQQAGPLRWPIFFVLGVGLIQVFLKLYELVRDKRVSAPLYSAPLTKMSLRQIASLIEKQEESMLSSLQSTMVNVFQTRSAEGMLHDEISNFVSFEQDQFAVFRRRMEFLSDTAGALGLMGTVWGMFTVFFQGTAEQDIILRGMGIALITTLLGLVVSIILNFSATELSTFFGKRLEQVSKKSDELRFRLMELVSQPGVASDVATPAVAIAPSEGAVPTAGENGLSGQTPVEVWIPEVPTLVWRYLELEGVDGQGRAGELLKGLAVVVKNQDGAPAAGVPVMIAIAGVGGALDGGGRTLRRSSDTSGRVDFACSLPERVGHFVLDISLPEQPGTTSRFDLMVEPAAPDRMEQEGNNQAAVAGMRLPLPLGVRVFDRFSNPVSGVLVGFSVKKGGGRLGSGNGDHGVRTGSDGRARAPFVVASEAGHNVVTATIDGTKKSVEFVAFGTEV